MFGMRCRRNLSLFLITAWKVLRWQYLVFYFVVALLYYTVYNRAFFIIRFFIGYGIYNVLVCLTTRYHLYIFTCTMTLHTPFVFCSVDISRSRALLPTERVPPLFIWNKPTHRSGTETINGSTGKNKQL